MTVTGYHGDGGGEAGSDSGGKSKGQCGDDRGVLRRWRRRRQGRQQEQQRRERGTQWQQRRQYAIASRSRRWPSSQSRPSACKSRWTELSRRSGTPRPSSAPRDEISVSQTDVPGGRARSSNGGGGDDGGGCSSSPPLRSSLSSSHRRQRPAGAGWEKGGMEVDAGGGRSLMAGVVFGGCGGYFFGVRL